MQRVGDLDSPCALQRAHLLRSPLEPWRPWLDAAGLDWPEPREGVQFNDLGLLMEAAVAGQGVALARRTIAQHWLAAGLLQRLFDIDAKSPHAYWLLYEQPNLGRAEVRIFIEWLRQTVRQAAEGRG